MNALVNPSMILKLAVKDWHLFKGYVLIYIALGVASALFMSLPYSFAYYPGVVMLITVLIGSSAHLAISSVVSEKKENQMSFIMALPINVLDYTTSKLIGSIVIYLICSLAIVGATAATILLTAHLPNGLLPMLVMCALEIVLATLLILSVGLLSGSLGVTIVFMIIMNIAFNLFLTTVAQLPGIQENIAGPIAVFNAPVFEVIGIELMIMLLAIVITMFVKSRKTCFL